MNKKSLKWVLIVLFWLLLWQITAMAVSSTLLLPTPLDTVRGIFNLLGDGTFYLDAGATVARCLVAIVLSMVFGFVLSLCSYKAKIVRDILALPVAFFKAVPVMAVAIYMILLLKAGNVPILVCFVMCFPISYTNLLTGLDSMDKSLIEMADVYKIVGGRRIRFIYLPMLYPHFKSAMSLIAGMSWKAIVTAEVLSIPQFSLGYELMNSKYYLETELLFAYVLIIIAISVVFEKLIKHLIDLLEPRAYEGSKVGKANTKLENINKSKVKNSIGTAESDLAVVELNSINKSYGDNHVLKNLSLKLMPNTVTACMGASGSGKTTLIRIITGLEKADSGSVKVSAKKTAVIFQEDRLLPWLNVYDNLAIVNSDKNRILATLKSIGLDQDADKLPTELSGGMKFRLSMARAFLYDADLLLADEPFQGLDADTKASVIEKLWKPGISGKTVFMITHDEEDIKLSDEIYKLN